MTFIITLIALMMERFFHWHHLRHWRWFLKYEHWLSLQIGRQSAVFRLIISILPPLIIVGLIAWLVKGWFYGILQLVFGIFVLLYCIGPKNLWVQVYQCINDMQNDDPSAVIDRVKSDFLIRTPENAQQFHHNFVRAIFIAALERIFSVIFWFVILGPLGAVLYRLIELFVVRSELGLDHIAARIKSVLDWFPIRVFTFLFALGGHFTEVFAIWKKGVFKGVQVNETFLTDCGMAALDVMEAGALPENGEAEKETLELLDRVFVMWLVILAIIVLIV